MNRMNKMNRMNNYRYKLASNKFPKLTCDSCGAKKHWQRYFDTTTGEVLPEIYGKCDNADKCGAWNMPPKDLYQAPARIQPTQPPPPQNKIYIPAEILHKTRNPEHFRHNEFFRNLCTKANIRDIKRVADLYSLGTIRKGNRAGAVTFPYIDQPGNIHAIQVKQFDKDNHTTKGGNDWIHSIMQKYCKDQPAWLSDYCNNEKKVSCMFGEHLLKQYSINTVAIVEAPKTAIYCTLFFGHPENHTKFLWLATGAKGWINYEKAKALRGRKVFLFPDLSIKGRTFEDWQRKAEEYTNTIPDTHFECSDLLEKLIPEQDKDRKSGKDLADYLDFAARNDKIVKDRLNTYLRTLQK